MTTHSFDRARPGGPSARTTTATGLGPGTGDNGATSRPARSAESATDGRTLQLTVAAHTEHVRAVRHAVREFAEHHRVARPIDVALAVSEACANVVLHAYGHQPPGVLHVTGFVEGELVYVTVADEGSGLTPRLDSPGLGLGLPIIARATDHFEITARVPAGTLVTMGFAHASAPEADAYEQVREDLVAVLQEGFGMDGIEQRIEGTPLSADARDALWLAAWATLDRRRRRPGRRPGGRSP